MTPDVLPSVQSADAVEFTVDPPRRILAVRLDSVGDVLLTEPALRALAAVAPVTLLTSRAGRAVAELTDVVDDVIEYDCPWIAADPPEVAAGDVDRLVAEVWLRQPDMAVIFTSQRQSPLPTALLLRLAGVPRIGARSPEYPGTLLDVRLRDDPVVHEVERNLALVAAMGVRPPDDRRVRVRPCPTPALDLPARYVVVHPGASVPARSLSPTRWTDVIDALGPSLHELGIDLVLTGTAGDALHDDLRRHKWVAEDLTARTDLPELVAVLTGADAVCVGNTGPMHLAAAVGTPVAACFPPTVALERWRPWMTPHEILGHHDVPCAGCHQRHCPYDHQPCLDIDPNDVVAAVRRLVGRRGMRTFDGDAIEFQRRDQQ